MDVSRSWPRVRWRDGFYFNPPQSSLANPRLPGLARLERVCPALRSDYSRIWSPAGLQEADAADVTQEVLRAVSRSVGRFQYEPSRGGFRHWLFTITRNKVKEFLSRARRVPLAVGDTAVKELWAKPLQPDEESTLWAEEWQKRLLDWAAKRIRHEVRESTWEAFWQTAVEGKDPDEVAAALRMSVGAVYIAKSRVIGRPPRNRGAGPPVTPTSECPSAETLQALLDGRLEEDQERVHALHIGQCAGCRQRLAALAAGDSICESWLSQLVRRTTTRSSASSDVIASSSGWGGAAWERYFSPGIRCWTAWSPSNRSRRTCAAASRPGSGSSVRLARRPL